MRVTGMATRHPGVLKTDPNTYRIRVRLKDPRTGKSREVDRIVTCRTVDEAVLERQKLRAQLLEDSKPVVERTRLRDYAASWLSRKQKTIARSTAERYATALDLHILPALGDYYVDALVQADFVRWRDAAAVSPPTVNSHLRLLRTIIGDAVIDLELPKNPLARVAALPEPPTHTDDDPNLLTADELSRLLLAAEKVVPEFHPIFATMAFTGMRPGEVTALRWSDVDLKSRVIRIRRGQFRGEVKETKTGKTRRVAIPEELVSVLERHRASLDGQRRGDNPGWVFPSSKGTMRFTTTLSKPLASALEEAELTTRITPHGFRRTFNNLLRQVTTSTVQKSITGHSTDRMAEHYSHVHIDEKHDAVRRVACLVRAPLVTPEPPAEIGH
ncbi:MAG: tyrosine-type recombinase/integrase [Polyangiaceae bacterium]|nr:tyrosine-type recombinase/integrase [Polyangiaceae bacterium]